MSGPSIALLARADEVIEQARCPLLALSGHARGPLNGRYQGESGRGPDRPKSTRMTQSGHDAGVVIRVAKG